MNWIDARIDLPKKTMWCLVFADGAMNCMAWSDKRNEWQDWCHASNIVISDITHWMPLPEPPPKRKIVVETY